MHFSTSDHSSNIDSELTITSYRQYPLTWICRCSSQSAGLWFQQPAARYLIPRRPQWRGQRCTLRTRRATAGMVRHHRNSYSCGSPLFVIPHISATSLTQSPTGKGFCSCMSILALYLLTLIISLGSTSSSSRTRYREIFRRLRCTRYQCRWPNCLRNDKRATVTRSEWPRLYQVKPHAM